MKKTFLLTSALSLLFTVFTASVNAQTDTTQPAKLVTTTTSTDRWNNWSPEKYKMLPMPEALTPEKIFPVMGKYNVTAVNPATTATSTPAEASLTISIDETNKGIAWVDGLPQGRIKAYLQKAPGTFLIPVQKVDEKDLAAGVMLYNKEANTLDICIGCAYNNDDPASAFAAPVVEEQPVVKTKKGTAKNKIKEKPVKTWKYSGTKVVDASASVTPMQ